MQIELHLFHVVLDLLPSLQLLVEHHALLVHLLLLDGELLGQLLRLQVAIGHDLVHELLLFVGSLLVLLDLTECERVLLVGLLKLGLEFLDPGVQPVHLLLVELSQLVHL